MSRGGIYQVTVNAAVNVSGTGGPVPSPISIWLLKGGSTIFYGLNQALPAETTVSGTNSQYLTLNTTVSLVAGGYICYFTALSFGSNDIGRRYHIYVYRSFVHALKKMRF